MKRQYANSEDEITANFFIGTEVEHSPARGMQTLFVTGVQDVADIIVAAETSTTPISHIYCGANQSCCPTSTEEWKQWDTMITGLLKRDLWVTLDFDVKYVEDVVEGGYDESRKFIAMISIKLPYIRLFNYNATIKIDDKGFEATNPGVWCHRIHNLTNPDCFTNWDLYKEDVLIK